MKNNEKNDKKEDNKEAANEEKQNEEEEKEEFNLDEEEEIENVSNEELINENISSDTQAIFTQQIEQSLENVVGLSQKSEKEKNSLYETESLYEKKSYQTKIDTFYDKKYEKESIELIQFTPLIKIKENIVKKIDFSEAIDKNVMWGDAEERIEEDIKKYKETKIFSQFETEINLPFQEEEKKKRFLKSKY